MDRERRIRDRIEQDTGREDRENNIKQRTDRQRTQQRDREETEKKTREREQSLKRIDNKQRMRKN